MIAEMDIGRAKMYSWEKNTYPLKKDALIFPLVSPNTMQRRWSASAMVSQGFLKYYFDFFLLD